MKTMKHVYDADLYRACCRSHSIRRAKQHWGETDT